LLFAIVVISHFYQYVRHRKISDIGGSIALLAIGGAMLVYILPNLVEPGHGVPIRGYGCALLFAILSASGLVVHLAKRQSIPAEQAVSLCMWTIITGIIGARLFYVTEYWNETLCFDKGDILLLDSLLNVFNFAKGGLTVFGSIIGGILGALIFMRRNKMPVLRTFDILSPAQMLGSAIGRIGCLLNGCCFGGVTESAWGIVFPIDSPAHYYQCTHGLISPEELPLPVHPTQIYSSCLALLLCGTLLVLGRFRFYQQRSGLVFATFMILYSAGRFMIEFVRTDEDSFFGTGLTVSQNVSILFFLTGIILFAYLCRKKKTLQAA
jgi:phosphatidylglycerol:prolipoprotein diacylglycerol transferase